MLHTPAIPPQLDALVLPIPCTDAIHSTIINNFQSFTFNHIFLIIFFTYTQVGAAQLLAPAGSPGSCYCGSSFVAASPPQTYSLLRLNVGWPWKYEVYSKVVATNLHPISIEQSLDIDLLWSLQFDPKLTLN